MSPRPAALVDLAENLELLSTLRRELLSGVEEQLGDVSTDLRAIKTQLGQIDNRLRGVETGATRLPQAGSAPQAGRLAQLLAALNWHGVVLILGAFALAMLVLTGRTGTVDELGKTIAAEVARQLVLRTPTGPAPADSP